MRTYGQYCPIARAAEIVAERWTPIIVRNISVGCHTYGEISVGAPGLSRSLLSQRLRQLERSGVVRTRPKAAGRGVTYELTEAGEELREVLRALGTWGERWVELQDVHTDPGVVLWAWCSVYLARDRLPGHRVLVRFEFPDQPPDRRRIWLLVEHGDAEPCSKNPGFEEDLVVETDPMTLARWHLRQLDWSEAVRRGRIRVTGPGPLARALPTWNLRGLPAERPGVRG